jgi:D-alanyl-D-alanine carboxypeptidase
MPAWLRPALAYVSTWLPFQLRLNRQPGCAIAVVHRSRLVLDAAWGVADLARGTALTPRHRFRAASHSKTFTAAGVMRLREAGRLKLDDRVGAYVGGLHPSVAEATIGQLLSHSAGLVRDGDDSNQWALRRPFKDEAEIRADLAGGTMITPNTRFKYSNHGYALLGLAIESITGERYADWIAREVVAAAGLSETDPDAPPAMDLSIASAHTAELPLGRRVTVPCRESLRALAPAGGFVSTAADLARFFAMLSPRATRSPLSVASRREMIRRQWHDPHSALERWYGLGTMSGSVGAWQWFGHSGALPGHMSRTAVVPSEALAISVLTNCNDGLSWPWVDGCLQILQAFARNGAPSGSTAVWTGRWWSPWAAVDLVPMKDKVLVANPYLANPLQDASELEVDPPRRGRERHARISLAGAFGSHGEPARLLRDARGRAAEVWLAGAQLLPEAKVTRELRRRFGNDEGGSA